jgi:hypothetical protein
MARQYGRASSESGWEFDAFLAPCQYARNFTFVSLPYVETVVKGKHGGWTILELVYDLLAFIHRP